MAQLHVAKIDDIIKEQFGDQCSNYGENTRLIEDLGMDSLDLVELVMAVEEDFDMSISDEKAEAWETIGDLYKEVSGEVEHA